MFLQEHRRWKLMVAILTLSLLTVMAGAAVAPALGVIQEYFSGESKMMVPLIISLPAVFIAVTNLFFEKMCRICKAKTLTLIGLGIYIVFGCGAGLFSNIYLVLVCRALADEFSGVPAGRGQHHPGSDVDAERKNRRSRTSEKIHRGFSRLLSFYRGNVLPDGDFL